MQSDPSWDRLPDALQALATVASVAIAGVALWRQQRQAERLKHLETELGKSTFEHQTRFARAHEKRAEVTAEIYRRVLAIEIWLTHLVGECELPDEVFTSREAASEALDGIIGHVSLSLQKLAVYFNVNRLYLEEAVCEKLLAFHDTVLDRSDVVSGYVSERFGDLSKDELRQVYGSNLRKRANKALDEVVKSRRAIESDFRALLGISMGPESTAKGQGLMWVPSPEMIDPVERD
jgi:hypothetical protein